MSFETSPKIQQILNVLRILQDTEQQETLGSQGSTSGRKCGGRPMVRPSDLDQYIEHVSGTTRKGEFKCKLCGKISTRMFSSLCHVESQHFPGLCEYSCDRCNKKFDTYKKLQNHKTH